MHLQVCFQGCHHSHRRRCRSKRLDPLASHRLNPPIHHHPYQDKRSNRLLLNFHTRLGNRRMYPTTCHHRCQGSLQCRVSNSQQWLDNRQLRLQIHHHRHPCLHQNLGNHRHRCLLLSRKPTKGEEESRMFEDRNRQHRGYHRCRHPYLRMNLSLIHI